MIGDDALILQGVRIGARVRIGDRFIAQPGAVIGADGFSFVTPDARASSRRRGRPARSPRAEQEDYVRINSLGAVVIGDDVEVGANSCIDRGTIADTTIGDGTKIDNHVQLGHNVKVGRDLPDLRPGGRRRLDGDRRPGGARRAGRRSPTTCAIGANVGHHRQLRRRLDTCRRTGS